MTNTEKLALQTCVNRINKLASLENANFSMNKEEDERIKKVIRPYMMWFEAVAMDIERVVELTEEKGFFKKNKLEEIIRLNL